ncbi:MAG: S-methyl-5-thioribose-1-phosphate isomerase [Hahellaceae bacterium]|nr:S-methyl-5-thioribose-1-phosphate isomerase [Hahellaceae bacterium]MCP5212823.1 S-methyl-5-thioribose-1-phosphate isomerase [Hahellaceae bacterium]
MNTKQVEIKNSSVQAIEWLAEGKLRLLDQRLLPVSEVYLDLGDYQATAAAITDMVVRGAPAIGITAAYAVVLGAVEKYNEDEMRWKASMADVFDTLARSRPTAVNLFWALDKMKAVVAAHKSGSPIGQLLAAAKQIHQDDIAANIGMGDAGALAILEQSGASRPVGKVRVLTHCNTGSLATGGYGTALGVIRSLWKMNRLEKVYADETRPWLQGARLTAWELCQDNIPVTLNADSAAAHLMKSGEVDWVIVGADRITANGDVANKIGTYSLAVLCKHHGVKFMVVAPTSTLDLNMSSGGDIPIEERTAQEVTHIQGKMIAPDGVNTFNPVFDVTPASLIDLIVTEKGVVSAPFSESLAALC